MPAHWDFTATRPFLPAVLLGIASGCASEPSPPIDAAPKLAASRTELPVATPIREAEVNRLAASTGSSAATLQIAPVPPPPPPPTASQLWYQLEQHCWAIRVEYDDGIGGRPIYRLTVRFDTPENRLYSNVSRHEAATFRTALQLALTGVRAKLRLPSYVGGGLTVPASEEAARIRLESRCWTYRMDYHRSGSSQRSFEILGRAHDDRSVAGSRSVVQRAPTLAQAVAAIFLELDRPPGTNRTNAPAIIPAGGPVPAKSTARLPTTIR